MIFENQKHWFFNIRVEMKVHHVTSRFDISSAHSLHDIVKIWNFHLDHKCKVEKLIIKSYDSMFKKRSLSREQLFIEYCDDDNDEWDHRKRNFFHYFRLKFDFIMTQTQNILTKHVQFLSRFQYVHDRLYNLFVENIINKRLTMHAFVKVHDSFNLLQSCKKIMTNWKIDRQQSQKMKWFNQRVFNKCIIQKEQVTSKDERSKIYLRHRYVYRDIDECFFIESMFVIQKKKNERVIIVACRSLKCEMRVFITFVNDDKEYLILL